MNQNLSCFIPTIESSSLSPIYTEKNQLFCIPHVHINKWRFSILSSKVDHYGTFVNNSPFNILCVPASTWNLNGKLKSSCVYKDDEEAVFLSYNYTKSGRL